MAADAKVDRKITEKKEDKTRAWLKNPYNLALAAILIFAIAIRLYYFFKTANQPLWWDEADYMAYAKNLAGYSTYWTVTAQHNSLFPFMAAVFFMFGLSEAAIKFLLGIIPSILTVYLTYEICILMYNDKRIALISTFLMAVFWELLFNSMRFHVEGPGLLFGLLAIYVFFKGYERREKIFGAIDAKWAIPLTVLLVILTYASRRGYFVFGLFFLCYMLLTKNFKEMIRDKYNWIAFGLLVISIFIVEKFVFAAPIISIAGTYYTGAPFSLLPLKVFSSYFENIFNPNLGVLMYLFWIGMAAVIIKLFFMFDKLKESENKEARGNLFTFLMIAIVLAYFLLYQRRINEFGEPRWYYPLLLGSLVCISQGTLLVTDFIKKYSKYIAVGLLVILIGFGGYYELKHADLIINDKLSSFEGIKEASLYIKEISSGDDEIISMTASQPAYYAERKVINPMDTLNKGAALTLDEFLGEVEKNEKARYMIVTFSEPNNPPWMVKMNVAQDPKTGEYRYVSWEIPFMNTTLDFVSNKQDIKQATRYGNLTFSLLMIKQDSFVYEIARA